MFYKEFKIPAVVEIGINNVRLLDEILSKNHLVFDRKVLFTQRELYDEYHTSFNSIRLDEVIFVKGGVFEEIIELDIKKVINNSLIIAFGGGSVLDLVKMMASMNDCPYISIPSTLSNDAIFSPISRLLKKGEKKSFGVREPMGIIVDKSIISNSPEHLLIAGVGDLISNLSAVKDCYLVINRKGERIDTLAMVLSEMSARAIMPFSKKDIYSDLFLGQLASGLIISGMAMILDKTSRPASGSEHLISHAIDKYYPESSTLHGVQVAWAQMMIEKEIRHDDTDEKTLCDFFTRIGLMDAFDSQIVFSRADFFNLIPLALNIRDKYTVLNSYNELNHDA